MWTGRDGERVPTTVVSSSDGPAHCDWQDIVFLGVGEWSDGQQYLRDTDGELSGFLRTTYAEGVPLPRAATDSGWRRDGRELWLTPDAAYLVAVDDPQDVERWPRTAEQVGCA